MVFYGAVPSEVRSVQRHGRTGRNRRFPAKAVASGVYPEGDLSALPSITPNRVLTLLPYTVLGLMLFFGCAKLLKLFSDEDRSFVRHLLPAQLGWITRLM